MLVPAASPLTDAHLPRRRLLASYLQLQTKARAVRTLLVISQAKCLKCHATEHTPYVDAFPSIPFGITIFKDVRTKIFTRQTLPRSEGATGHQLHRFSDA